MEEQFKNLEKQVDDQNRKLEEQNRNIDQKFEEIMKMMQSLKDSASKSIEEFPRSSTNFERINPTRSLGMTPKLEFPRFNGTNPRIWVKKCCKYFKLCKIPDDQRVDLASLNMTEKAESWVTNYLSIKKNVETDWNDFVADLNARFKDNSGINVVEQFNKLQQLDVLEDYIDEFENLRSVMLQNNHILPDAYILDSFIGGLKPAVKPFVRAFKPVTVSDAIEFARLQEESLSFSNLTTKTQTQPSLSPKPLQSVPYSTNTKPPILPTPQIKPTSQALTKFNPKRNTRYIPADVRAEKIAKGLCYYCDQPYNRDHKCNFKEPQLFTVEVPGNSEAEDDNGSDDEDIVQEMGMNQPCISVSALSGNHNFHTMRVKGMVNGKPLHILIDSGSTHNFLDLNRAKKLGCHLDSIEPQAITVADGNHIACQEVCSCFVWKMGGIEFSTEVMLIPLGSCDMVLGIQWLSTLGTVNWNFKKLLMEFEWILEK